MPATKKKPTALVYVRLSLADKLPDGSLDSEAIERQERACRRLAAARGLRVLDVVADNDLSASRYARRRRPGFARVLDEMRAGSVDVVLAAHLDRLTRQPKEIEELVDIVEATGVELATVEGPLDLSTGDGRAMARVAVAFAAHASDSTSRRMKSQRSDRAHRGEPVRTVAGFGWDAGGELVPAEAEAIVAAARAVLGGATLASVARSWQEAGLRRRRSSAPWRSHDVRTVLLNPRHAGRAVYRGDVVGELDEAAPRILDAATHDALVALLTDPSRSSGPRRRRAFSGVLRCGRCGNVLARGPIGTPARDGWRCSPATGCGRLSISAEPVEDVLVEALLRVLDGELPAPAPALDADAVAELRELDRELVELGEAHGRGELPLVAFVAASKTLTARRDEAARRLAPSKRSSALAAYSKPGALRTAWPALDEEARNVIVRAVIDAVVISPAQGRQEPSERIGEIAWLA
jgi:DNA invertase Pin-like site-specific DNA recombinase